METNLDDDDRALLALKEQMTEQQRQDMAELLQNELRRRRIEKMNSANRMPKEKSRVRSSGLSSGLDADSLGDMYSGISRDVQRLKLRKLEHQLEQAREQQRKYGRFIQQEKRRGLKGIFARKASRRVNSQLEQLLAGDLGRDGLPGAGVAGAGVPGDDLPPAVREGFPSPAARRGMEPKNLLVIGGVLLLAVCKVLFSSGIVDAAMDKPAAVREPAAVAARQAAPAAETTSAAVRQGAAAAPDGAAPAPALPERRPGTWSPAEKRVLTDLDARRVELEKRKLAVERQEQELAQQSRIVAERLAELRGLSAKIAEVRKEKDARYESRLEQLAEVYGSMAPKEAAPLIGRLGNDVALALLQRMTGKRMGQILSVMDQERAIELTQLLTDKQQL